MLQNTCAFCSFYALLWPMPLKPPPVLLLAALLLTVQLSCVRSGTTEPSPTASPSPTEQAMIDQILERYVEALGGQEAIAGITSLKMKGTFQLAGITGTIAGWRKEPDKTLTVDEIKHNIAIDDAIFRKP